MRFTKLCIPPCALSVGRASAPDSRKSAPYSYWQAEPDIVQYPSVVNISEYLAVYKLGPAQDNHTFIILVSQADWRDQAVSAS